MTLDQGAYGWHKSTRSGEDQGCIEQGIRPDRLVAVRDTKMNGTGDVLTFDKKAWKSFVENVS